jgi:hypothetical protein
VKALPLRKEDKNVKTKTNTGITATNVNKANHMEAPTSCPIKYNATYNNNQNTFGEKRKVSATRRISDSTKRYDGLTTTMMGFAQMEFAKPKNLERAQREIEGDHQ